MYLYVKATNITWKDISRDKFVCPSEDAMTAPDSVMTSTEPMTAAEQDDNIPVTVYNGTRYQPVDTFIPQPPSNQNWIPYTISVLVLVCIVPVIMGVVFVVRRTPTIVKRRSDRRTNARNKDSGLLMRVVQSSALSENCDSASNMADVDKESTSIHHYEIREATTN